MGILVIVLKQYANDEKVWLEAFGVKYSIYQDFDMITLSYEDDPQCSQRMVYVLVEECTKLFL